ncbi:tetratricopeptide repeat protein [Aliinostoc sp. HNIBRCY26]|uniref:tetratricopeptide repeat protein n=1 Tax=Aliinostoc sp. HNIBRCY26 TaxID=3418997 RepID=UPI003CFD5B16
MKIVKFLSYIITLFSLYLFIVFNNAQRQLSQVPIFNTISGIKEEHLGNKDSAIAFYNKAIELEPNNFAHYVNRGMFFAENGDPKRAFDDYNKAIKLNPKNPITYDNRGFLKSQMGDNKGAISDYSQAIAVDPNFIASYISRYKLYVSMGDKKKAIGDLHKIADIYKSNGQEAEYQQVIQEINTYE